MTSGDILDEVPERFKLVIERLKDALDKEDVNEILSCLNILDYPGAQFKFMTREMRDSPTWYHIEGPVLRAFAIGFLTGTQWGLSVE